jgi:hypothetical protein
MSHGLEPFKKDQFEGCVPTVYAATVTNDSGQYICPPAIQEEGSEQSQSEGLAESLMELTRNIVREKTQSESAEKGCPFDDIVFH